jgi:hypothetical protein
MWLRALIPALVLNVAVTEVLLDSVTLQAPVPEQPPPDHPPNVDPEFAVAVRATTVPLAKLAEHVEPQLMPAGELLTDPVPLPDNSTDSCGPLVVAVLNVAVTDVAADAMMLHVPVPLHAPDHPANVDPLLGVAASVMAVPAMKLALHVWPQLMPAGVLLTVPDPLPASTTLI